MNRKKLIAPIIITVVLVCALVAYFALYLSVPMPIVCKVLIAVIGLGLIGVSVFVLVERIQEIRKGEEDDLSKY